MTKPVSIYIHIPFCLSKCSYCAFYSLSADEKTQNEYCERLIKELKARGGRTARPVCSVYFGGGTPSILGAERLSAVLKAVYDNFNVEKNAEITLEANPADNMDLLLKKLRNAGFNRISFGVQSANEDELKFLNRRHNNISVEKAVKSARNAGFENISLDLMLGLPESNTQTLKKSIDFAISLAPEHISAYILKIEENTPLAKIKENLIMPDDDQIAEQYLFLCEYLENCGYLHYEISNFAKSGFESRHNSRYWTLGEYLGFGPSAHSFFDGKRFYYQNDLRKYIENPTEIFDGEGGTKEEYIMLGLRLSAGISSAEYEKLFGKKLSKSFFEKAKELQKNNLLLTDGETLKLTDSGMLVSNSIITYLLEEC